MSAIKELYKLFLKHPVVCTDSRKIEWNSIFFALKGDNFDGNSFALKALESGAAYSVTDDAGLPDHKNLIKVESVLSTLQRLARHHRKKLDIPVIGITGTNGKTTTKELLNSVLSQKYKVLATAGNFNNHIGVPLTLLKLDRSHELAIIEMGANHVGEIDYLSSLALPDFGIITNIGRAHLKGFGSYEGVLKAKTELYKFIKTNKGRVFVNADDKVLMKAASGIKQETYGFQNGEVKGFEELDEWGKVILTFSRKKKNHVIHSNLFGHYNAANMLAAISAGYYFKVPVTDIIRGIESYIPQNNRSQLISTEKNKVILDAYNANPSSMAEALKSFDSIRHSEKIIVLGDMLELGDESTNEHKKITDRLSEMKASQILLVGNEFSKVSQQNFRVFRDVEELTSYLEGEKPADKLFLIKGSRGIQLEKCLDAIP